MEQARNFVVRPLTMADLAPDLLKDFAHCQRITKQWVRRDDGWALTDVSLLREWSAEKRSWIPAYMRQQIDRGGVTVGAFSGGQLIGFCCVDAPVSGHCAKYANLTMLFVDDHWKRRGIGTRLLQEAREHARKLGADKLFISAIPSAETIAFYLNMGCVDAHEIVGAFVDSEDDRYLELALNPI